MSKPQRPRLSAELLEVVNKPIVQSLLYDLDLLPEQLSSQQNMTPGLLAAYNRLEGVLLAFWYMQLNGTVLDPIVPKQENGPESEALSR